MSEKSMNYYLLEANRVKIGGYNSIKLSFLEDLVAYLYSFSSKIPDRVLKRFENYCRETKNFMVKTGGINYKDIEISVDSFLNDLVVSNKKYLLSSEDEVIRKIYMKANLSDAYNELAFILFLTGIVDGEDYLKQFKNINTVMKRFVLTEGIKRSSISNDNDVIKRLDIDSKIYSRLMGAYLKNTTEGIDYGFSPYDFIYHIISSKKTKNYNSILNLVKNLKICNFDCFKITKDIIEKYNEEVLVILPLLVKNVSIPEEVLLDLLLNCDIMLREFVLKNSDFIKYAECDSIQFSEIGVC